MKNVFFVTIFFFFTTIYCNAQISTDSIPPKNIEVVEEENDTIIDETILLDEVIVTKHKLFYEDRNQFLLLQKRVFVVYPYAKTASERLMALNYNRVKFKTNKEKKKYLKIVENYLENEFSAQLKKLSKKQGQILIKLIYRQTGFTTYELIKEHKSGWKAFWSNNTAKLFNLNLKSKYNPYDVNEDFLIETILDRAFIKGRLVEQKPAIPIDLEAITQLWQKRAIKK
jgi:hypothetical protein